MALPVDAINGCCPYVNILLPIYITEGCLTSCVEMGNIDNFICDYCRAKILQLSQIFIFTKTNFKMLLNVSKNEKNSHDK